MKTLTEWFDAVYVIHCAHRKDRLEALKENLLSTGVVDISKVILYPAVIGKYTQPPNYWKLSNGAWGCLQSHRRVIEDVLHIHLRREAPQNVLVLEDDVYFLPDALERINTFMEAVPDDWGQLYFGGQHRGPVTFTDTPEVIIPLSVNRAHAYALHKSAFKEFYAQLHDVEKIKENPSWLNDQLIEDAHREHKWPVYCPPDWVCGQDAGYSDVCGKIDPKRVWEDIPDELQPNLGSTVTLLK
tara:strand:+ start:6824 stop:7549 length:726 start_codon:yes stop_codon:yes gene_type:complete